MNLLTEYTLQRRETTYRTTYRIFQVLILPVPRNTEYSMGFPADAQPTRLFFSRNRNLSTLIHRLGELLNIINFLAKIIKIEKLSSRQKTNINARTFISLCAMFKWCKCLTAEQISNIIVAASEIKSISLWKSHQ